jgi:hypothetical protein
MSGGERRQSKRVIFEYPVPAQLMAIDGTWRRECSIYDVSDEGAKLAVGSSIEGLLRIFPRALDYGPCLPALQAGLGQWRPDRRHLHPRPSQETLPA